MQVMLRSSHFPAICGTSPFLSRQQLFRQLRRGESAPVNDWMLRGQQYEKLAVGLVEAELGLIFDRTGNDQQSRAIECRGLTLTSTPDGVAGRTGLEVKIREKLSEEPPVKSLPQLAGQMLVWDLDATIYAELSTSALRIWRVHRSVQLESTVLAACRDFAGYLIRDEIPPRWSSKACPRPEIKTPEYERIL